MNIEKIEWEFRIREKAGKFFAEFIRKERLGVDGWLPLMDHPFVSLGDAKLAIEVFIADVTAPEIIHPYP